MKPITLVFALSLVLPTFSGILYGYGVYDSLLAVKGAPTGPVYGVFCIPLLIMNFPGLILTVWWAPESLIYPPGWRIVYFSLIVFLSWSFWIGTGHVLLKAYMSRVIRNLEPAGAGNPGKRPETARDL